MVDAQSQVTNQLDPDTVRSILDRVALRSAHQAKVHSPTIVEGDHHFEQEVCVLPQAVHLYKCMLLIGLNPRRRTRCWVQCWIGWRHRRRKIWRHFWQKMPPAKKASWSYGISRILQFIREPYTCTQCPKVRLKIFYTLWSLRPIMSPPWMGAIGMQVIRDVTTPCPYCGSISGGQAWPIRCNSPLHPVHIACNMRAICPKHLYIQLWPPLWWTSYM